MVSKSQFPISNDCFDKQKTSKYENSEFEIGKLGNHVVSCSNAMIQEEEIDVDLTGFKNYFWIYPNNYVHGFK